jgi:dipeptidyl aminopeptidase/acylaminoacyl peptidase
MIRTLSVTLPATLTVMLLVGLISVSELQPVHAQEQRCDTVAPSGESTLITVELVEPEGVLAIEEYDLVAYDTDLEEVYREPFPSIGIDLSPDGRRILYATWSRTSGLFEIYDLAVSNVDGSQRVFLGERDVRVNGSLWTSDSERVLYGSGDSERLIMIDVDAEETEQIGSEQVAEIIENSRTVAIQSISPDDAYAFLLVTESRRTSAYIVGTTARDEIINLRKPAGLTTGTWSPDGRYVAMTTFNQPRLYLLDMQTRQISVMFEWASHVRFQLWYPDSQRLIFSTLREDGNGTDVYSVNVDGTDIQRLTDTFQSENLVSFSPDGEKILYFFIPSNSINMEKQYWLMNADGSEPCMLFDYDDGKTDVAWSSIPHEELFR